MGQSPDALQLWLLGAMATMLFGFGSAFLTIFLVWARNVRSDINYFRNEITELKLELQGFLHHAETIQDHEQRLRDLESGGR